MWKRGRLRRVLACMLPGNLVCMLRRCTPVIAFLALAVPSFAWIDTGHMVIAQIAQTRLQLSVSQECDRLLAIGCDEKTNTFVMCACWADDHKTKENGPWHYTNVHFRTDGKPTTMKPEAENVVWAIEKFSKLVADRKAPDAERADALRFLIHFVGDVHQPMHNTARDTDTFPTGDRGGNDFPLIGPPNLKPEPRNLHFLWDIGCGLFPSVKRPLSTDGSNQIKMIANRITSNFPVGSLAGVGDKNPAVWSAEGVLIAKEVCYNLEPGSVPTDRYLQKGMQISAERAALAGYRLASLLNRILR